MQQRSDGFLGKGSARGVEGASSIWSAGHSSGVRSKCQCGGFSVRSVVEPLLAMNGEEIDDFEPVRLSDVAKPADLT